MGRRTLQLPVKEKQKKLVKLIAKKHYGSVSTLLRVALQDHLEKLGYPEVAKRLSLPCECEERSDEMSPLSNLSFNHRSLLDDPVAVMSRRVLMLGKSDPNSRPRFTQRDLDFIVEHWETHTAREIGEALGRSMQSVRQKAHLLGLGPKKKFSWGK